MSNKMTNDLLETNLIPFLKINEHAFLDSNIRLFPQYTMLEPIIPTPSTHQPVT